MENYPFIKCLHPQSIVNPYTNERLLVECGRCKACRCRKGSIAAMKCKLESLSHKYCIFVTLTYDNDSVPLMDAVISYVNEPDFLVEHCERNCSGSIIGRGEFSPKALDRLRIKCNTFGMFPHLLKKDAQLFMKRLRKYISNYESEKLRYYLVGEYGPVHFRPHYHILLWFSSEQTYKVIRQAVSSCWRYGRIDVETSKGDCADYVAKYVNGSCSLPRIYQQKETKPFALHSIYLGEMVLRKDKKEVYEMPVTDFILRRLPLGSHVTDVNVWRSLKVAYFPRCKEYALRSRCERLQAYGTFCEASRIFQSESITYLADSILSEVVQFNEDFELLDVNPYKSLDKSKQSLVRYFIKSCKLNPNDMYSPETYAKYFRKVYMELRLSRHFISFCCDGNIMNVIPMYQKIEKFWDEVEFLNLTKQFQDMEEFCHEWYSDEEDLQLFYANVPHDMYEYFSKPYYQRFHWYTEQLYERTVKHKKLNDMNNIFADK